MLDPEKLVQMIDAGMNIARCNMSEHDHNTWGQAVASVREAIK